MRAKKTSRSNLILALNKGCSANFHDPNVVVAAACAPKVEFVAGQPFKCLTWDEGTDICSPVI